MADTPAPSGVRVSVVLPHYNDVDRLDRCLDELARQTIPRDSYEVIVADNASPQGRDAVAAVIARRARLVVESTKGAGPARNAGVAAAQAPLLAFIDADCVPAEDWLEQGIAALAGYDIVGGRVGVSIEGRHAKSGAEAFEQVFAFDNESYVRTKGFSVTANLFCSRATFDAVGPFRIGVSEDVEWCHRATAKGFTLGYADAVAVSHPARRNWAELRRKWERLASERSLLDAEELRLSGLRSLARSWLLPASILVHAPRIWRSPALATGAERRRAFATLARIRLWRMADAHRRFFGGSAR